MKSFLLEVLAGVVAALIVFGVMTIASLLLT
jgi:hypothetical protein